MGEPVGDAANRDDADALGGEREMLEPIWSELDFISNGDLKDIFVSSDIGLGKVDTGLAKRVEDGSNVAEGLGREKIGADFWKLKEEKDQHSEHQSEMDALLKEKQEVSDLLTNQGVLSREAETLRVKEEPAIFQEGEPLILRQGLSNGKEGTNQDGIGSRNSRLNGGGGGVTRQEEMTAMGSDLSLEDVKMREAKQVAHPISVDVETGRINNGISEEPVAGVGNLDSSRQVAPETGPEAASIDVEFPKIVYGVHHSELGGMLKDGCLSSEGLANMGMVITDDSSEEESESSEEEEEEEESESEDSSDESSSSTSDSEDMKIIKEKIRKSTEEVKEDSEPPRTKHELAVLPPVPKVEAVLEPQHKCVRIGLVSSVVDLNIVVEGDDDSRVLSDGSILWLSESRVPLGIVDEVFGPVKKPYYLVRFNEVSEIHESAKVGAEVSCVAEFAEFVLKDNPSLYKKAIDASGLDDEELSDAEIEFSDDEKEMAAKQRDRGKRGHEGKEAAGGHGWDTSDPQPPEAKGRWQRKDRGRGRGNSRGPRMAEGVDSAATSVADMDIHGSGYHAAGSGNMIHGGRGRSRPAAGRAKFQSNSRPSNSGGWDGHDLGSTYSRLHDGLSRGDWVTSPTRISSQTGPSASGSHHQAPLMRREELRDGPWYSEQADIVDRQPHQAIPMQGHSSFGVAPIHRHLQVPGAEPIQQVASGFSAFNYSPVPGPQIATDGRGNFFHITGPVNMPPDVGNVGRSNVQGMGMNLGPTVVSVLPQASPNSFSMYNNQLQGTLTGRQGGYDPVYQADVSYRGQHGGFVSPASGYSSRVPAPDFRFQAMSPNSQNAGPSAPGGLQGPGYDHGPPHHGHRNRYQGSRGR
ncbi:H/ACA ribonucleoprotein complex non-core subunit NAF1 [Marchantia polymorpha subsp. ruderalis]